MRCAAKRNSILQRVELVRAKGLEPPHLSILDPKSSASTNSATPARTRQGAGAYTSRGAMGKRLARNDLARRGVCRLEETPNATRPERPRRSQRRARIRAQPARPAERSAGGRALAQPRHRHSLAFGPGDRAPVDADLTDRVNG